MQLKEIRVRISKDGQKATAEPTKGFVGPECLKATGPLEAAIGKLEQRDPKPEMGQTTEIGQFTGQG